MKKCLSECIYIFLFLLILGSCKKEKDETVFDLFSESYQLSHNACKISEDSLASIEGLACDEENLIVFDYHSGSSYTLFNIKSGDYIARFGTIGQGPDEILLGCCGYLHNRYFTVFNDQTRTVVKYSLDSLYRGVVNGSPVTLTKYKIPDAEISKLISINDSTFVCAGTYKSRYQFLLFDNKNNIMDYGVDIYNASDSAFNVHTKFLSNQGDLVMNPQKTLFAYSVNFSSNIDFFSTEGNKIQLVKSLRLGNPISKPVDVVTGGSMYCSVDMTRNSQIGYINLCASSQYVYALFTDKKVYDSARKSNIVLVFDWEGNPIRKYTLDAEAYYIAVDEVQKEMFAAIKNKDSGWSIVSYDI